MAWRGRKRRFARWRVTIPQGTAGLRTRRVPADKGFRLAHRSESPLALVSILVREDNSIGQVCRGIAHDAAKARTHVPALVLRISRGALRPAVCICNGRASELLGTGF